MAKDVTAQFSDSVTAHSVPSHEYLSGRQQFWLLTDNTAGEQGRRWGGEIPGQGEEKDKEEEGTSYCL